MLLSTQVAKGAGLDGEVTDVLDSSKNDSRKMKPKATKGKLKLLEGWTSTIKAIPPTHTHIFGGFLILVSETAH